jgi:hypothetical protein
MNLRGSRGSEANRERDLRGRRRGEERRERVAGLRRLPLLDGELLASAASAASKTSSVLPTNAPRRRTSRTTMKRVTRPSRAGAADSTGTRATPTPRRPTPARPTSPPRPTQRTDPRIRPSMTDGFAYPTGVPGRARLRGDARPGASAAMVKTRVRPTTSRISGEGRAGEPRTCGDITRPASLPLQTSFLLPNFLPKHADSA